MNRLTKFILAFALAFLAVIIGMGIGNRLASKRMEPISPSEVSVVAEEAKEKEDKTKAVIEEWRKKEQKRLEATREKQTEGMFIAPEEEVSPPTYSSGREAYPETEFAPPSQFEEGLPPEMYPPQAYPLGHPSEELSEGQYPPYDP